MPSPNRATGADLSAIVKAYDIRGVVPDQLDEDVAAALGAAFVRVVGAAGGAVVVGRDMRPSSPGLAAAFAEGATSQGADVVDIGLASTDQLYYASGSLDLPGAMFTASHNPARYNGIKLCRAGARAPGPGLRPGRGPPAGRGRRPRGARRRPARCGAADLLGDYAEYLRSLVDLRASRRLTVVVDAGNGMGGPHGPDGPRRAAGRPRPALLRARRHLPEPRGQPAGPRQPRRPAGAGAPRGGRHRAGVRRRRRPLLRRRRAGRAGVPVGGDRAGGGARAGPAPGRDRAPQPHHLPGGPRDRAGERRHTGPDPRGALVHQGGDGAHRCRLRRRALGALLLPGLLAGRHRHARRPARALPRWASRSGRSPSWPPATSATSRPARSTARSPTRPLRWRRCASATPACPGSRSTTWTGMTVSGRGLVVQPARLQHRAPAASQRRGRRSRHDGECPRRRPRRSSAARRPRRHPEGD